MRELPEDWLFYFTFGVVLLIMAIKACLLIGKVL